MRVHLTRLLLISAVIVQCGCVRESLLDHESADMPNDRNIVVVTKHGWQYQFAAGEYASGVDSIGNRVLQGSGLRQRREEALSTGFMGTIRIVDIEKITVTETTPWMYLSISGVLVAIALSLWLGWFPLGRVG